ncbi:MAG: response regulator, partial [Gammaproteobacteria bacterium]|nr:response regulator [Gammaproteobacteria bacterium]
LEELVEERTYKLEQANLHLSHINIRLREIVKTTSGLTGCSNVGVFGTRILDEFARHMVATGGSLYLIEEKGLRLLHSIDPGHASAYLPFPLPDGSVLQQVINSGKPLLIEDIKEHRQLTPSGWSGYQDGSVLVFPIPDTDGESVGVLTLHSKATPPFIEQDKEIGAILASYSCETLRAAKAFESLQASERRYRTLFDKTNDAIFLVEYSSGIVRDANAAAAELAQRPLDKLRGIALNELVPTIDKLVSQSQLSVDLGIVDFHRPDSGIRKARFGLVSMDQDTLIALARDVTEEQAMERQFRRAQKMDAMGQLTGGIAHDFNNLLGVIIGNINLLSTRIQDSGKPSKEIAAIEKATQRASDLVKQLLGFSRRQASEPEVTDINRVIIDMRELIVRSMTPEVKVKLLLADDVWMSLLDKGDLEDALLNLVINARDAMPDGGELVIETSNCNLTGKDCAANPELLPGDYILLQVRDTGIGMEPETIEHIFEPFFTTKGIGQGTGLGLSMVFGFVKRTHGHIRVSAKIGRGTAFYLYLPRSVQSEESVPKKTPVQHSLPHGSELLLVVDDEAELLELAKLSLESLGYRVLTAGNGNEALQYLIDEPEIELLFSDLLMPGGINGYELAERAVSLRPHLKVLMTSGYSGKYSEHQQQTRFAKHLLHKPYSQSELAQRVREILEGKPSEVIDAPPSFT